MFRHNNGPYIEDVIGIDWKLIMWLASLKQFDNYVDLFILVWNVIGLKNDNGFEEFNGEVNQMKDHIKGLLANQVINDEEFDKYSCLLDNYRTCRDINSNNHEERNRLSSDAYHKLLIGLKASQKKLLRQMILDRMDSFVNVSIKSVESLREQIATLDNENSHLQAALGNMTNTRPNDQDPNNAAKLNSDIMDLQQQLSDFTTVYESVINDEKAKELFASKQVQLEFTNPKAKTILEGCLQRLIIEQILTDANSYFQKHISNSDNDETLEIEILNTTNRLIESVNRFREKRPGRDNITQITPIKVRQQIYSALGCRGFSNYDHPLIVGIAEKIRQTMDEYRKINDENIEDSIDQSIQITRKVISIIYFRLKIQQIHQQFEPTYRFFESGDEIDIRFMEGSWGRGDFKKLEVEVCYFPCIAIRDNEVTSSNPKVFTKAQVFARPKKS
ncbi:1669_t:CDS:2 [Funneliformis geosporum]|uniref:18830_t:CDS:1 n=1 Tax=Funneliformis geosporum TaxID=1117311 RepID=A0A9W4SNH8_9GLOM|nr:18830_t:CDS:2 [Funneliformis geosporum]CAI2181623.1 1669_t:CDS:2 [Funneliformis geosporum]